MSPYNKIYEFEYPVNGTPAKMIMTSVSGHLLNYAFSASFKNWNSCDPLVLFDAPVFKTCMENYAPIKSTLEREIRSCNGLIIWTDCDREGENIGFEIIEVCKAIKPNIRVLRAKFSEMTKPALQRAMNSLTQPDERQSQAVDVRSQLDLRIGAAFTRFQTLRLRCVFPDKIESLVSYGSCQIPTLGFVVQRYNEVDKFVAQPFWKVKVIHTVGDVTVDFNWARNRLFDRDCCEAYFLQCQADPTAYVESVVEKSKSKWRPTPLDTVELEKLGSRKLRMTAKDVMTVAEKLYSQGIISYPRTETNQFSKDVNLRGLVEQHQNDREWGRFAQKVLQWGPSPRNGRKSDQAHPPIHPTKYVNTLEGNERKVYELVVRHFLACVSRDAVGSETIVQIRIAQEEFSASGLVIKERNYLEVYPYDKWNSKEILNYEQGTHFQPTEISMPEGSTTAPSLLTEADLIGLMEKHGIGTDATHAEHINTIKQRGYIGVIDRGFLVPGLLGMGLVEGYDSMNLPLAQPELRAELEADLKRVCEGTKNPEVVLREQVDKYREVYKIITERALALDRSLGVRFNTEPQVPAPMQATAMTSIQEVMKCPKCNRFQMMIRRNAERETHSISCLGFPDCKNAIWFGSEVKEVTVTDETCFRCGNAKRLSFKFKSIATTAMFNCFDSTYTTCVLCDRNLREVLDIRLPSTNSTAAAAATANAAPSRNNQASRNNASTVENHNRTQSRNANTILMNRPTTINSNHANNNRGNQTGNDSGGRGWNLPSSRNDSDPPGRSNNRTANKRRNTENSDVEKCPSCSMDAIT